MYRDSNALRKLDDRKIKTKKKKVVKVKLKYFENRIKFFMFVFLAFLVILVPSFLFLVGQAKSNESTYKKSVACSTTSESSILKPTNEETTSCFAYATEDKAVLV